MASVAGTVPRRQHLDPLSIKDLLPNVWLMDVEGEPPDYRYRLVGTSVVNWLGGDYTGRRMREVHPERDAKLDKVAFFKSVVDGHEPHWYRGPPRACHRREVTELENLILPLAADGKTTDMLLGFVTFFAHDGTRIR